jgi:hypothetical protein
MKKHLFRSNNDGNYTVLVMPRLQLANFRQAGRVGIGVAAVV